MYADLKNAWSVLKKGGILAGDDMHDFQVAAAVVDFSRDINKTPMTSEGDYWFIKQ